MPVRQTCASVVFALLISAATVEAQAPCGPNDPGGWWPPFIQANWRTIPTAEKPTIDANMSAAEALVKQTAYGTPRGFAARGIRHFGDDPPPGQVRWYSYGTFGAVRCSKYDEHTADITVIFNPHVMDWSEGDRGHPDENGDLLFSERAHTVAKFGSFSTFGTIHEENTRGFAILFTAGGESPTIPVTREEWLKAQIFTVEGKDGAKIREASTVRRKQYQEWVDRTEERKKEREQMLANLAAQEPSKVAQIRADMEKADKEAGEFLKKLADEEPENAGRLTEYGDKLRAEIAAMAPAERASPAWLLGYDFVAPMTPGANAIVRTNRAFYRARKSPVEVRAILVLMPNRMQDEVREQHLKMYQQFDWAALKRLLAY